MSALSYIVNYIRDPNIASIWPTSSFGIERICKQMDFSVDCTVVEYGPATGVITAAILKRLTPGSKVIALDTNERFLEVLSKKISDPRLIINHTSAENVLSCLKQANAESAKYIISGIPFTMLPTTVAENIVRDTHAALEVNGKFLVYQFLKPEIEGAKGIHSYLPAHFSKIEKEIEWLNIPPLWVYEATKTEPQNH